MDYTPNSQERAAQAEHAAYEKQRASMMKMAGLVLLLVGVMYAYAAIRPQAATPQQPAYYWPDPTPAQIIDQHTEVNIFSKNEIFSHNCIGSCR